MTLLAPVRAVLLPALAALACACGPSAREATGPTVDLDMARPPATSPPPDPRAPVARYPIRWTHHVALENLDALEEAMSSSPGPPGTGDALVLESRGRETVRATTCAQYLGALARGFHEEGPPSAELRFVTGCAAFRFLSEARPSKISYLADLRLDRDPLRQLPETMSLDFVEEFPTRDRSLGAYRPDFTVTRADATSLVYGAGEAEWKVDVLAFGDFDHDGIEDVLLRQTVGRRDGRPVVYTHVVLTRRSPGALLHGLAVSLGSFIDRSVAGTAR